MSEKHKTGGALSHLILEAQREESYQKLADRAVDHKTGRRLSKAYLQKLAAGASPAPYPEALRALAAALRQPLEIVQRAAAEEFLGYAEEQQLDDDTRVIIARLAEMPPAERRRWRRMVEASEQD